MAISPNQAMDSHTSAFATGQGAGAIANQPAPTGRGRMHGSRCCKRLRRLDAGVPHRGRCDGTCRENEGEWRLPLLLIASPLPGKMMGAQ